MQHGWIETAACLAPQPAQYLRVSLCIWQHIALLILKKGAWTGSEVAEGMPVFSAVSFSNTCIGQSAKLCCAEIPKKTCTAMWKTAGSFFVKRQGEVCKELNYSSYYKYCFFKFKEVRWIQITWKQTSEQVKWNRILSWSQRAQATSPLFGKRGDYVLILKAIQYALFNSIKIWLCFIS